MPDNHARPTDENLSPLRVRFARQRMARIRLHEFLEVGFREIEFLGPGVVVAERLGVAQVCDCALVLEHAFQLRAEIGTFVELIEIEQRIVVIVPLS